MAKLSKTAVDKELRDRVLDSIYYEKGNLDLFKINLALIFREINC